MKEKQTRKQKLIRFIKRIPLYLRHGPFMLYWLIRDYILSLWVLWKNIDYIGVYIKIMSPSEEAFLFDEPVVGFGYAGFPTIKIGFRKQWMCPELVAELLNHEVLHQVITRRINWKTSRQLDNIHRFVGFNYVKGIVRIGRIKFLI